MIEAKTVILVAAFALGCLGGIGYFIMLKLHPSWDKEASRNVQNMGKTTTKVLFVLLYSGIGGVFAIVGQYYYTEPVFLQAILIGFNWPMIPRIAKIS